MPNTASTTNNKFFYDSGYNYAPPFSVPNGVKIVHGAGRGGETMSGNNIATRADAANFQSCVAAGISGSIVTGYSPITITIGPGAILSRGSFEGYEQFVQVILHELQHALVSTEVFAPNGVIIDVDNDGYDDLWESNFSTNYPVLSQLMSLRQIQFTVGNGLSNNDKYQSNYSSLQCITPATRTAGATLGPGTLNSGHCTAGTVFEELLARRVARQATLGTNVTQIKAYDWSYDNQPLILPLSSNAPANAAATSLQVNDSQW